MVVETEYIPKRIIQIISGSRSGSSLLKSVLAKSPDVTSLAGEEEPYIPLSGNGYGYTSKYDGFTELQNPSLFRKLITTELTTEKPWEWRLGLQYKGAKLASLLEGLDNLDTANPFDWLRSYGVAGYYDGCQLEERLSFSEMVYEMPPYVLPNCSRNSLSDTLLLKSPYNVYRQGVLEKVYPTTEFSYVILTRNPAATINGLIDGWKANYGFYKHLTPYGWWKFEMPPDWENYVNKTSLERSWHQWESSYTLITGNWKGQIVRFEDLVTEPEKTIKSLCKRLEIEPPEISKLPLVMSTEKPEPYRWKKRANRILQILERSRKLIVTLNYLDERQWI